MPEDAETPATQDGGANGAPSAAPETSSRDAVVMALIELKRVVLDAAAIAPESVGANSLAQLLKMPVLEEPLNAEAIAAELLAACSHIKLLQNQNRQQKATIETLKAEKIQMIQAMNVGGAAPAASDGAS